MRSKLLGLLAVSSFLCIHSRADTYLSSMGNAPQSSEGVWDDGIAYDEWGMPFITGPSDYTLDSVTLMLMQNSSASPLTGSLYLADANFLPSGSPISTDFTLSAIPSGSFGAVTFTPGTTISLNASTAYVFVLSTSLDGSYGWRDTTDTGDTAIGGWSFPQPYVKAYSTTQYGDPTWDNGGGGDYHFMGAIEATAVPEPSTLVLGALGVAILSLRRTSRSSAN